MLVRLFARLLEVAQVLVGKLMVLVEVVGVLESVVKLLPLSKLVEMVVILLFKGQRKDIHWEGEVEKVVIMLLLVKQEEVVGEGGWEVGSLVEAWVKAGRVHRGLWEDVSAYRRGRCSRWSDAT